MVGVNMTWLVAKGKLIVYDVMVGSKAGVIVPVFTVRADNDETAEAFRLTLTLYWDVATPSCATETTVMSTLPPSAIE